MKTKFYSTVDSEGWQISFLPEIQVFYGKDIEHGHAYCLVFAFLVWCLEVWWGNIDKLV